MRSLGVVGISLSLLATSMDGPPVVRARHNRVQDSPVAPAIGEHVRARSNDTYGKLSLYFEANRGQTDDHVNFLARGRGYTMFLAPTEAVLVLSESTDPQGRQQLFERRRPVNHRNVKQTVIRTAFIGANQNPRVEGVEELRGKANYFIGNDRAKWRTNVPTYARVRYQDLYAGIDLIYRSHERALEYDFMVHPGADPAKIILGFKGADKLEIDDDGDLVVHSGDKTIRQRKPVIYQDVNGVRKKIPGAYGFKSSLQVGIQVAKFDPAVPLVIDPEVLFYSTYLGGTRDEFPRDIEIDAAGNAYLTGYTFATDFPTTAGALQPTSGGDIDAFVTKLNSTGSGLVYSTYLGGDQADSAGAIAIDNDGNAYVGGSASPDFPTTVGAFQTDCSNAAFVTKLNSTGSGLVYSTCLGHFAQVFAVAVDPGGNAYVAGQTYAGNFPTTVGAFDTTFNGGYGAVDAFITKLNAAGSGLLYSTFLGGSGDDLVYGIKVDTLGNAYVTGYTHSADFPVTLGAFQPASGGYIDGFVTKIDPTGSFLVYSTYFGGGDQDVGFSIAVDSTGDAYVAGNTSSLNFPTTAGVVQPSYAGGVVDAFVLKFDVTGANLIYSTYLGGSDVDTAAGVTIDDSGNAYLVGSTSSIDFPTTGGTIQRNLRGNEDAFVTKLDATASGVVYSTYLGGTVGQTEGTGIAVDAFPVPNTYIVGGTNTSDFATTRGAFQTTLAGNRDAFVTKISEGNPTAGPFTKRVTGGGTINVVGGIGSFSFMIDESSSGARSGHLQYFNHASGARVVSETYTSLTIIGNTATFDGTGTVNGGPCTFKVNVMDNGEPGTTDVFTISVSGGPPEGGILGGGNILIQQQ